VSWREIQAGRTLRRVLKIAITALVTAGICFAATASIGAAHRTESPLQRNYTVRNSDTVWFPSIDLFCMMNASDRNDDDPGPALFCTRESTFGVKNPQAQAIGATRFHMLVSDPHGDHWSHFFARSP
jgi:hypothetical protein